MSAITKQGYESGSGWNPDAAVISCIHEMYEKEISGPVIVCHLGGHEYCKSLVDGLGCESAEDEMELVLRRMLKNDRFSYIVCRVGSDEDPFSHARDLRHHYAFIPDEPVSEETMTTLYRIVSQCSTTII